MVPQLGHSRSLKIYPEGPSTQFLRTLVPKAIKGMDLGIRVLKYWVHGPSGIGMAGDHGPFRGQQSARAGLRLNPRPSAEQLLPGHVPLRGWALGRKNINRTYSALAGAKGICFRDSVRTAGIFGEHQVAIPKKQRALPLSAPWLSARWFFVGLLKQTLSWLQLLGRPQRLQFASPTTRAVWGLRCRYETYASFMPWIWIFS